MRVDKKSDNTSLIEAVNEKKKNNLNVKMNKIQNETFIDALEHHNEDLHKELDVLLKKLDEIGVKLVNKFSVYDLKEYKEVLRRFMSEVNSKSYKLFEETGWTRHGRPKVYQRLEELDKEMQELSRLVISKQKDPIKILKKLDIIRGLIVDLYT